MAVKKVTTTKPKTTSKVVNNKVTTTKPSTTVTKPSTAPKTTTKTGSNAINNKVTATTPKVSNDSYVPMMGSVLNDHYGVNKSVNNNDYTRPSSSGGSSGGSSGSKQMSSIALQPDGNSYQYNNDGSYNILGTNGNKIGWGAAGTEALSKYSLMDGGSGSSIATPNQQNDYSAMLKQLEESLNSSWGSKLSNLQSTFDSQIGDWTNKYNTLQSESEKKYQDLLNQFNYAQSINKNQLGNGLNQNLVTGGGTVDETGNAGADITSQNAYNDTLYKYLQNIWKGGF